MDDYNKFLKAKTALEDLARAFAVIANWRIDKDSAPKMQQYAKSQIAAADTVVKQLQDMCGE